MMTSPIVFRASFEQPKGPLNRIGAVVKGPILVEVFHLKIGPPARWAARNPSTKEVFRDITPQSQPAMMKQQIEEFYFERRLTPWEVFDTTDRSVPGGVLLQADEWQTDRQGKVFISEVKRRRDSERLISGKKTAALERIK